MAVTKTKENGCFYTADYSIIRYSKTIWKLFDRYGADES